MRVCVCVCVRVCERVRESVCNMLLMLCSDGFSVTGGRIRSVMWRGWLF